MTMGRLERKPGGPDNWLEKVGGLDPYLERIAAAIHERRGKSISNAIQIGWGMIRKWAAGGGDVNADTRAKAAKAVANMEAKRARNRALSLSAIAATGPLDVADLAEFVDLSTPTDEATDEELDAFVLDMAAALEDAGTLEVLDLAPGDYRPPYDWKHGYIPLTPAAAAVKAGKGPHVGSGKTRTPKGKRITAGKIKKTAAKAKAEKLAKALDDEQRGRGTPGAVDKAKSSTAGQGMGNVKAQRSGKTDATPNRTPSARAQAAAEEQYLDARRQVHKEGATLADQERAKRRAEAVATAARNKGVKLDELELDNRARKVENGGKPLSTGPGMATQNDGGPNDAPSTPSERASRRAEADGSRSRLAQEKAGGDAFPVNQLPAAQKRDYAAMDPEAQRKYRVRRARGESHAAAVRAGREDGPSNPARAAADKRDPWGGDARPDLKKMSAADLKAERDRLKNYIDGRAGGTADDGDVRRWKDRRAEVIGELNRRPELRESLGGNTAEEREARPTSGLKPSEMTPDELRAERARVGRITPSGPAGMRTKRNRIAAVEREQRKRQQEAGRRPFVEAPAAAGDDLTPAERVLRDAAGRDVVGKDDAAFPNGQKVDYAGGGGKGSGVVIGRRVLDGDTILSVKDDKDGKTYEWAPDQVKPKAAGGKLEPGTPVVGQNPGGLKTEDGRFVGYDENGWHRIEHTTGAGRRVTGSFNPEGTKRPDGTSLAEKPTGDATAPRSREAVKESAREAANPSVMRERRSQTINPDATIRVKHGPDGTTVEGTTREDAPDLKAAGFKWSRNLGAWYLPRTWGENTRAGRVRRLQEKMGDKVGVDLERGPRKSAAERDAETRERAAGRAERMDARAEKQTAESRRRMEASDLREEKSGIPFGQPILVGHHSESKHRRTIERAQANARKGVEAGREAERASDAAERARRTASGAESKVTTGNRIAKLEAEQRDINRRLEGASGARAERLEDRRAEVADDLAFNRQKLEAAGGVPSKDTVSPGDFVKVRGQWYPVKKSNAKTVGVPNPMIPGRNNTTPWREVQEHRKAGDVTRDDVAGMVQETSRAFPGLAEELRKAAPPKGADRPNAVDAPTAPEGRSAGSSETGQTATPAAPGGITPEVARKLTDEQLDRAMERLMADGTYSGPAYDVLDKELARRDAARAEGNPLRR